MTYPIRLLPKENYKIIKTNELLDKLSPVLVRTTTSKVELDDIGDIKYNNILDDRSVSQVFNLSVNLLGIYLKEDVKINIVNNDLNKDWFEGNECIQNVDEKDFEISELKDCVYFKVSDLDGKPIPYKKNDQKGRELDFEATCKVLHKPTQCNFWHYEISYQDIGGQLIKSGGSTWLKRLADYLLRTMLVTCADINVNYSYSINDEIYQK